MQRERPVVKALSLDQPWASGIPAGLKKIETRDRRISHRGRLAIHATLAHTYKGRSARTDLLQAWTSLVCSANSTSKLAAQALAKLGITKYDQLPAGAIIATCDLIDCVPTTELLQAGKVSPLEYLWGNYAPGRYGYILDNVVPLEKPVPCRGYQYLFDWDERSAA